MELALILLGKLIIGHFLCDFPLQGDFLSKAKNHHNPIEGVPPLWAMSAHCAIQAGMVWYLTGFWLLGSLEFVWHMLIDYRKCSGEISFNTDQILHIACKVFYVLVLINYI